MVWVSASQETAGCALATAKVRSWRGPPWRLGRLQAGVLKWQHPILMGFSNGLSNGLSNGDSSNRVYPIKIPGVYPMGGWHPGLLSGTINVLLYLETVFIHLLFSRVLPWFVMHFHALSLTSRHANQPNQKPWLVLAACPVPQRPVGQHRGVVPRHCADPRLHVLQKAYQSRVTLDGYV